MGGWARARVGVVAHRKQGQEEGGVEVKGSKGGKAPRESAWHRVTGPGCPTGGDWVGVRSYLQQKQVGPCRLQGADVA